VKIPGRIERNVLRHFVIGQSRTVIPLRTRFYFPVIFLTSLPIPDVSSRAYSAPRTADTFPIATPRRSRQSAAFDHDRSFSLNRARAAIAPVHPAWFL
jgi:hypothetical protein